MIFKHIKPLFDASDDVIMTSWLHYDIRYIYLNVNVKYLWSYKLVWTLQIWISQISRQNSHPWCCMRLDKRLYTATCTHGVQFGGLIEDYCLTIIVCGGKALCAGTGCTQYIRNSTSEIWFCLRDTPFSTRKKGQIGVILCINVINNRSLRWCRDCKNSSCGSLRYDFLKYSTSGLDRK